MIDYNSMRVILGHQSQEQGRDLYIVYMLGKGKRSSSPSEGLNLKAAAWADNGP